MSASVVGFVKASFAARATPGAISVPGLQVGDRLVGAWLFDSGAGTNIFRAPDTLFEATVSVADEIQQLGGDVTSHVWDAFLVR